MTTEKLIALLERAQETIADLRLEADRWAQPSLVEQEIEQAVSELKSKG